jgi:hypothetical protein
MLQHRVDADLNLRLERLILGFEVDEGDGHIAALHLLLLPLLMVKVSP